MKISAIVKLLKDIPLFSALDDTDISYLIKNSEIKSYAQGKEIIANDKITVILKGSVIVTGQNDGKKLLIRMLGVGNLSGVASLFSDQHNAISTLTAQKATEALIIPHATVETLIGKNPEFALSYLRFLTSRIRFLNGKIKAYTVDSAEEKLALYLFMANENNADTVELSVSLSTLASMLDMGRASLYRAFDTLTEKGIISRAGKTIIINSYDALKQISHS